MNIDYSNCEIVINGIKSNIQKDGKDIYIVCLNKPLPHEIDIKFISRYDGIIEYQILVDGCILEIFSTSNASEIYVYNKLCLSLSNIFKRYKIENFINEYFKSNIKECIVRCEERHGIPVDDFYDSVTRRYDVGCDVYMYIEHCTVIE